MNTMASSNSIITAPESLLTSVDNLENNLKKLVKICYAEFKAFEERTKIPDKRPMYTKPILKNERTNDRVVVFPESDLNEVLQIMQKLNIDKIGVIKHLWNKEIVGYVYCKDIEKVINSTDKKIFPKDLIKKIDK